MDWSLMSSTERHETVFEIINGRPSGATINDISDELEGFRMNLNNFKNLNMVLRKMAQAGKIDMKYLNSNRDAVYLPRR